MKQGFIAFFLVAALSILLLLPLLSTPKAPSKTKLGTLELEQGQFLAANAKRALVAHLKYALPALALGLSSQDPQTSAAAQTALASSLAGFELYAEQNTGSGTDIDLWCGSAAYSELDSLARASVEQKHPKKCNSCLDLGNPACTQYVQLGPLKHSAQIAGTPANPLIFSGFGLTLCSPGVSLCIVSYLPQDYEVFF